MITVEEKLNVFTKLVLEKVQKEYEEKLTELEKKNDNVLNEHRKKIEDKKEKIIKDMINKGKIEKNRLISRASVEKKRKILTKRQELIDRLIKNITDKVNNFTQEESYKTYLQKVTIKVLENLKDKNNIQLYITKRDSEKYMVEIQNKVKDLGIDINNIEIKTLENEYIGGVIGLDKDKTVRIDQSLKTLIEDNRDVIGTRLNKALEEMGDTIE